MTRVIVMGASFDIDVDANPATTETAVREFLIGRCKYDFRFNSSNDIVITPLPNEGVDRRDMAVKMKKFLNERFAEQSASV